jgi:hypothetical protein
VGGGGGLGRENGSQFMSAAVSIRYTAPTSGADAARLVFADPRVAALELAAEVPEAAGKDEVAAPAAIMKPNTSLKRQGSMFDIVSKGDANQTPVLNAE